MPIFNYSCTGCGHVEENKMVKKHDDIVDCPVCGEPMKKDPSNFGFQIEPAC